MRLRSLVTSVATLVFATPAAHAQLASGYQFALLALPGSDFTDATGINNAGEVIGVGRRGYNGVPLVGFRYADGAYRPYAPAGAPFSPSPLGINDANEIVGGVGTRGFLDSAGVFRTFAAPGGDGFTSAAGVNNGGQIVGGYTDAGAASHGYLYQNGAFTTIDFPVSDSAYVGYSHYTLARGINNAGQIVGSFAGNGGGGHGFLRGADGTFMQIDAPGADETEVFGINDRGDIVGTAFGVGGQFNPSVGFVDRGGVFTFFSAPNLGGTGSYDTGAFGINNAGQVVGYVASQYRRNGSGRENGYIATPLATTAPEPATLALSAAGLAALGAVSRRRSRGAR